MPNIQQAIEQAAGRFALEVVNILRGATLSELQALAGRAQVQPSPAAAPGVRSTGGRTGRRADGSNGVAARGSGGGGRKGARGESRVAKKRSPEEVARLADRVLEVLKGARQEMGVSAIAGALKVGKDDLGLPLSRLRDTGKVKTHGKKRSTVYRLA